MKLKNLTTDQYRCSTAMACPAVYEVLAEEACAATGSCPAVLAEKACDIATSCPTVLDSGSDLIIIGKRVAYKEDAELKHRVGPDEWAVRISRDLVKQALTEK
jgi:hypothetical protein